VEGREEEVEVEEGRVEEEVEEGKQLLHMESTESAASSASSKMMVETAEEEEPEGQEVSGPPRVEGEGARPVEGARPDSTDSPTSIYQVQPCPAPRHTSLQVKWVSWGESPCPVITQNENGPCPLLRCRPSSRPLLPSIANVLLLRGKLSLPEGCEVISAGHLLESLAELLLQLQPGAGDSKLDFQVTHCASSAGLCTPC
jgi:hypothetical protein